ncbi:MAG TPA: type II secretion system minor pseudopilin GspK [Paucimonas sp.]|nr:type II secretion system minor pseudopilin GspK [Paucimonas sp.]
MRRAPSRLRQRGVAVVTALLLTTLAITIVASLFWQQQVQIRSIENQRLQLQKQWILRGALDWARVILRADAATSNNDNLTEPWAVPLEETRLDQYVENGRDATEASDATLSGSTIDAQSRFNLTNLCSAGAVNPAEVKVFAQLLANLQLPPALAQATANLMSKAQKRLVEAPNAPQPLDIRNVEDLLAVPGFTLEIFNKLKDHVVVLPKRTTVNINTASAEVLSARIATLTLSEANALVAGRKRAHFRSINEIQTRLPGKQMTLDPNDISIMTNYFIVNGNVRLNRAGLRVRALIERDGQSARVLWIRED